MTELTYTITKHFFQGRKFSQTILFDQLETREIAEKHLKMFRLQNKNVLKSAIKRGDMKTYNERYNTTFSITINISTKSIMNI